METQLMDELQLANVEAERNVIGAILMEPELYADCFLKSKQFYDQRHINLMETFRVLTEKGKPIDPTAIFDLVGERRLDKIGGIAYFTELAMGVPSTSNFMYYQSVVREYFQKREMVTIGRTIMQETMTTEEPSEVRQSAMAALDALEDAGGEDDDDGHIGKVLVKVYDWMEKDHGEISGTPTGYRDLDKMLSGVHRQELIIVAARPSVGKTAFATNIATNIATKAGEPVAIFSLEMPDEGLGKRMISTQGNIDAMAMRNPAKNFSHKEWMSTTMALAELGTAPLHIFDKSGVDVSYIRKKSRMLTKKYPGRHLTIVIDYLQLIMGNPKHGGNRTAEIGEISRMLKGIARELDITVIALSQLSRGVEQRQDKRPMMSDIRESGQIEQDADVIAFLYRDDYYDKETADQNMIEIIIAKQRNGPVGTVKLAFVKEYSKFVTIDWGANT